MITSAFGHHLTDVMTTVNRKLCRWRKRKRPNNWFSGMAEFAGFAATPRPPRGRPEAAAPAPSRHWHSPGSARKPGFIRCSELEIFLFNSAAFNLTVDRTRGALRIVRWSQAIIFLKRPPGDARIFPAISSCTPIVTPGLNKT